MAGEEGALTVFQLLLATLSRGPEAGGDLSMVFGAKFKM